MTEQGNRSFKARYKLERSTHCGCYFCGNIYSPMLIEEWVDSEQTAICPKCGIDSVVPLEEDEVNDQDGFREKLKKWKKYSFDL